MRVLPSLHALPQMGEAYCSGVGSGGATMGLSPGEQVTASLRLIKLLGQGGMGSVWSARHSGLDLDVAVKFIASELVKNDDPLVVERFKREAQLAARIDSPHVVRTFDHGMTSEGVPYIVMELLRGESLHERLARRRRLPPVEAATIVTEVAKGLERAHALGIVHRDIKPHNVFLAEGPDGEEVVKLLDFGVAKARTNETQSLSTSSGVLIGTPQYMSPEQLMRAGPVDPSADLWALSVLAYEMITGKLPFRGETLAATLVAITRADLDTPSSSNPGIPVAMDAWFLRALAIDPDRRFATARELSHALRASIDGVVPISGDVVPARTGNIDIGAIAAGSGTGEFLALRGIDIPTSVRAGDPALAATQADRKLPSARGTAENVTLPSAQLGDAPTAAGVALSRVGSDADLPKIEEGPETRFRKTWTPRRMLFIGAGVLAVGAAGGVVISRWSSRTPPAPPLVTTTASPSDTAMPSATADLSAAPSAVVAPHVVTLGTIEKTTVDAGYVPLSRVWLPTFFLSREDGDQDRSLLDAQAACQAKAMSLCTESQWTRACAATPAIATLASWTSSTTEKGVVVRGGPAGPSAYAVAAPDCTRRDVMAPDTHDPHRIGVCCSRAVGVSSQVEAPAFLQTTSRKLLEFETSFNSGDAHGLALQVDDPMMLFVKSETRDQVADYFAWRAREGQYHVHDACEVQMVKRDDGDGWTADCIVSSLGRGGVVRDTRRYTRGGPKGLLLEILEPKPPIILLNKG